MSLKKSYQYMQSLGESTRNKFHSPQYKSLVYDTFVPLLCWLVNIATWIIFYPSIHPSIHSSIHVLSRSAKGWIHYGTKIGHLQTGRPQQQTKCIPMFQKHLERSVVVFGSICKSNFWRVFAVFWDFFILTHFHSVSLNFRFEIV